MTRGRSHGNLRDRSLTDLSRLGTPAHASRCPNQRRNIMSTTEKTALPVRSRTKIYAVIPASDNPRAPQRPGKKWKRSKATTQSKAISRTIPTLRVGSIPTGWGARTNKLASDARSEEHKSELQSLMRNSYAVFCLKKKIYYT